VQQLFHYTPSDNVVDVSSKLSSNKGDSLQLPLQEEGTHMVVFNSTNSFISLEADKFNDYLKEDGLDEIAITAKNITKKIKKVRSIINAASKPCCRLVTK
jgi:hypothetical protein